MNPGPPRIFDESVYRAHRARGERLDGDLFLAQEAASNLAERLSAINRRFENGLDLHSRAQVFRVLEPHAQHWVRMGLEQEGPALPFAEASFDLITSVLSLHAVNDLPGALTQIRRALRPDGVFIAALFGGETLRELKQSFAAAEAEILGGASPRVAPFADVKDLGGLLQRAGFALPVADTLRSTVRYSDLARLFADLRAHGETNALVGRRKQFSSRRVISKLYQEYRDRFAHSDGRYPATFDIVFLTGWAPHESQQKPLAPGSAKTRLAEALGAQEISTGEKPAP